MLDIIINAAPGLMAYWDRDLRCRFASRGYAEWFGRQSSEELLGLSQEELLPEATYRLNSPLIARVLAGVPQQFEREFTKPDGSVVHTLTHYVPDIVGRRVIGFTTHVTDVSQLKESEATLRAEVEERQRANKIIRSAVASLEEAQRLGQIGNWSWTVEPDTTSWSKQLFRIMGRDPAEPSPSFADHGEIYTSESWARLQAAVEEALGSGVSYRLELEYRRPDGATGWLDARGEAVRNDSGRITGLRGTVQVIDGPEGAASI
jgi:PAS domain S-box-containing protein